MAYYEKQFVRDGVPVPIQCILIKKTPMSIRNRFHYHEYTELLYGIEGIADVFVGDKKYKLNKGDTVIIHNYEIHDVRSSGVDAVYIVIKFLPSILLTSEQTYHEYSYALCLMQNTEMKQNYFKSEEFEDTPVPALFYHAMKEWNEHKYGYELGLRSDVTTIFMHILRKWHDSNMSDVPVSNWQGELIQRIIAYVNKNYVDLTEESISKDLGVSTSYLSRTFKKGMKISFSAYVNTIKLREAERMLISSDMSITEIGACVGFSTSAYFIANFKKRHSITPSQYRKTFRG